MSDLTTEKGLTKELGLRSRLAPGGGAQRTSPPPVLMSSIRPREPGGDIPTSVSDRGRPDAAGAVDGARTAPQGSSDRILLVEDNPVNQRVAVAMLETLGYCVDAVDNGVEAVITATMVPYRAILMDCEIPVLNGYEVTKEIRGQRGASRCSPIIAVTSASTELDRKRCLASGMDGHLAKPLTLETLAAGLARWAPPSESAVGGDPDRTVASTSTGIPTGDDSDQPVLDAVVVGRLERLGAEAGEDLLGQLAALFLADADARMIAFHEALAREDGPALIQSAHTLCGASANLGAAHLARLCARLATDGSVGDRDQGEALLRSVEVELARVRSALLSARPTAVAIDPLSATPAPTQTSRPTSTPTPLP